MLPVQVAVASNVVCLPHTNMNQPAEKLTAGDNSFPELQKGDIPEDPTDGMAGPQPVLFAPDLYGHYQETSPVEEDPTRSAVISEAGTGGLKEGTNTNAKEVEEPSLIQSLLLLMALQGMFGEQADSTAPRILPFPIKRMEDLVSAASTGV